MEYVIRIDNVGIYIKKMHKEDRGFDSTGCLLKAKHYKKKETADKKAEKIIAMTQHENHKAQIKVISLAS